MRRMKKSAVLHSLASLTLLAALAGCSESSTGPQKNTAVASLPVLMGNFHINTGPVTTNQDGKSKNIVDDYVLPSQLPNVNFEVFTTFLYAPTSDDVSTSVSNVKVFVRRTDGTRTGDIFLDGRFVSRVNVGGQAYAMYELNGLYRAPPVLTKASFANVAFELRLSYEDSEGRSLADRDVVLSVYQRN